MSKTQRVIITGGPGTGKTTLLHSLKEKGFPCHTEVSRAVIKQQLELNTRLVPWDDLSGFSHIVNQGQKKQFDEVIEGKCNFYDRGIPDVLAYLRKEHIHEEELEQSAKDNLYHSTVFLTPPWPDIYAQDEERREDLESMMAIHNALIQVYESLGYQVKEVPKMSIEERVNFVLTDLKPE